MTETQASSQNNHILSGLTSATECAQRLTREGFTVLSMKIEKRNPVVWIQNCARCGRLPGATMIRRRGPHGPETVMAAHVHGCQVQWVVRGH